VHESITDCTRFLGFPTPVPYSRHCVIISVVVITVLLIVLVLCYFLLQEAAGSVCQSKVSTASLVTDIVVSEHTSVNGPSGISVITAVPCSRVEQSEDWKRLETEDWKGWKEEVRETATAALPAHTSYGLPSVMTAEPVTAASDAEVCDLRQMKSEQALNYSTVGFSSSSSVSDVRSGRVVASVAPCAPVQPNKQPSPPWKAPLPGAPPPLLHSTSSMPSHDQSLTSPLPTSVIQSPVVANETSPLSQNDSDDSSEQELRNRTPSPEPCLVNEECCRSKNAMYATLFYNLFLDCNRCLLCRLFLLNFRSE